MTLIFLFILHTYMHVYLGSQSSHGFGIPVVSAKCPECSKVISADTVEKEILQSSNHYSQIQCPECHREFQHIPRYAIGDPRNIVLIGHWDGWQPFGSTGQHSCDAHVQCT